MALKQTVIFKGLPAPDTYVKISALSGEDYIDTEDKGIKKFILRANVTRYTNATKKDVLETVPMIMDKMTADDICYKRAYEILQKELIGSVPC